MKFLPSPLEGAYLIDLELKEDSRGFFARYYCEKEFNEAGLNTRWVQVNNSLTLKKGTLRGLHFQRNPHQEIKLIRCVRGKIYDVIVDLRKSSASFGSWYGEELSEKNRRMMYVPEGFAHGFISLSDQCEIIYLVSEFYSPGSEGDLLWSDNNVGISWPLKPSMISEKDSSAGSFLKIEPL